MNIRELITKFGFEVDEESAKNVEKRSTKMLTSIKAAAFGIAVGVFGFGAAAISAAADMEMLTTQFEVMLGSTEAANKIMEELKTFASETPFALEDLAKGSQNLLAFGVQSDKLVSTMRMLGDTAGGNSEKLNGLVLAYGKVSTKGKASMEEINMIAEKGIPIIGTLSKQLGVNQTQFFDMVSAGKISAANVEEAFKTMTSEGGVFFEGMKKQSLTFHGIVSTMKDNFKLLLAEIGTTLLPVMKEVINIITDLTKGPLKELIGALAGTLAPILQMISALLTPLIQVLIPVIKGVTDVLVPLIQIISSILIPVIKLLLPVFKLFGDLLSIFGKYLAYLAPNFEKFGDLILKLIPPAEKLFATLLPIFERVMRALIPLVEAFFPILETGAVALSNLIPILELFAQMLNLILPVLEAITPIIAEIIEGIVDIFRKFQDLISSILEELGIKDKGGENEYIVRIENADGSISETKYDSPPSMTDNLREGITNNSKTTNVSMKNNINVNGDLAGGKSGKKTLERVAESVFTLQLKKVLASTEY